MFGGEVTDVVVFVVEGRPFEVVESVRWLFRLSVNVVVQSSGVVEGFSLSFEIGVKVDVSFESSLCRVEDGFEFFGVVVLEFSFVEGFPVDDAFTCSFVVAVSIDDVLGGSFVEFSTVASVDVTFIGFFEVFTVEGILESSIELLASVGEGC